LRANVCFVSESFDFSKSQDVIARAVKASSDLVEKYYESDGFVSFSKSSDFDEYAARELFKQPSHLDGGTLMGLLYDANMGKADTIKQLDSTNLVRLANAANPVHGDAWLSLYSSDSSVNLSTQPLHNVSDANTLVKFGSLVLASNKRSHDDYATSFVQLYKNLFFLEHPKHSTHKSFNSIRKTEGGYQSFIQGITDCLAFMDQYNVIPHDSQDNVKNLNAALDFSVTPEGGGKNKRTIKALKRDFLIDNVEYKSVNCEYHYKLERIDGANGKGTYYFNRIYFGFFNRIDPEKPSIAIAHIGEHL